MIIIKKLLPKIALLFATVIWGASFVVMKGTLDSIHVFTLLTLRFSVAFIFLAIVFFKKMKKLNKKVILQGAVLGVVLFFAYSVQTYGLKFSTPGKNAFLTAVYCVLVPFMFWFVKKIKPDKFNVISAFVCITGVGLVSLTSSFTVETGDLLSLLGGVLYAVHIIFIALFTKESDPVLLSVTQFFFAGICAAGATAIFEADKLPSSWSGEMIFEIAYLAILCTAVAFILQMYGQKYESPSSASLILSLESVFGVTFSVMFGKDKLSLQLIAGFLLIFAAIIISETKLSYLRNLVRRKKEDKQ